MKAWSKLGSLLFIFSLNANTYLLENICCVRLGNKLLFIFLVHVVIFKINHAFRSIRGIHLSFLLPHYLYNTSNLRTNSFWWLFIWLHIMHFTYEILLSEPTTNFAQGSITTQISLKVMFASYSFLLRDLSSWSSFVRRGRGVALTNSIIIIL